MQNATIAAFILCLAPPAFAQAASTPAPAKDEQAESLSELRTKAEQGDAESQFLLGFRYENGLGVKRDNAQAVIWLRKAADQGVANAQINLGLLYQYGIGIAKDEAQAIAWYRKAAAQGDALAQKYLRDMGVE